MERLDLMDGLQNRCTAKAKSTGDRCKLAAIAGGNVCARYHGGAAPQVQAAADRRLIEAGELIKDQLIPAARELARLVASGKKDEVRLAAVKDVFDRAGLQIVKKHEVKTEGEFTFTIVTADDE